MISPVMANANAAVLPMARARQPEHAATPASPSKASASKAAEFADQIARLENMQASQAEARKPSRIPDQSEKPDALDTLDTPDMAADSMAAGLPVPVPPRPHQLKGDDIAIAIAIPGQPGPVPVPPMPHQLTEGNIAIAIAIPGQPEPVPGSGENTIPAMQELPNNTDLQTTNDGRSNVTIGTPESASKSPAPISAQSGSNNQSGMIGNTHSTPPISTGPMSPSLSGDSGDMQALVSEFETSVNHFERAGNQWVGNARIVFQSTVLSGTSVQITGDGKSLNIVLAQSALSSTMASLHHQEKQLCNALTRRLGRTVTLHIEQTLDLDTQAADDAEPQ